MMVGTDNQKNIDHWVRRHLAKVEDGVLVVDAGAGSAPYRELCGRFRYVTLDTMVSPDLKTWDIDIVCDIAETPYQDGEVDVVLCTEVLEHVPDPVKVIKELARIVKPGGTLLISAPMISFTHQAPFHFCTGFNRFFYMEHLVGFDLEITRNGTWASFIAQELLRLPSVVDCDKGLAMEARELAIKIGGCKILESMTDFASYSVMVKGVKAA